MKPVVLYYSMAGNTKKVAEAMASELNCDAVGFNGLNEEDIKKLWEKYVDCDLVFLGSGTYAMKIGTDMIKFLKMSPVAENRKFALYGSWIGRAKSGHNMINKLKDYIKKTGQKTEDDYFLCYGQMNIVKRGHPNNKDLDDAKAWAKSIAEKSLQ